MIFDLQDPQTINFQLKLNEKFKSIPEICLGELKNETMSKNNLLHSKMIPNQFPRILGTLMSRSGAISI